MMKARPLVGLFYLYTMDEKKKMPTDYYIGIGLCIGVALGVAFENIALGISLGLVFGAAFQQYKKKQDKK